MIELDTISREPGRIYHEDYYAAMLKRWLDWAPPHHSPPTLSALVAAIRAVGMGRVADNLEQLQKTKLTGTYCVLI